MYRSESEFPYAEGYYGIFPRGAIEDRPVGAGSIVIEEDYTIYFRPDTPQDVKDRFVKDYAEAYKKRKASGVYPI